MPERHWSGRSPWLTTPAPIKRLFARFPLATYPENSQPNRAGLDRAQNILFIFDTDVPVHNQCLKQRPSFNPSCLTWQTYLLFAEARFTTHPSSNHASPTGSLPFLLPSDSLLPVPSSKLEEWAQNNTSRSRAWNKPPQDPTCQAYATLISQSIRRAWLYTLYLDPTNRNTLNSLYIRPSSTNTAVRTVLDYQLRSAATSELLNASEGTNVIDIGRVYRDAERAWEALSAFLEDHEWFSQAQEDGSDGHQDNGNGGPGMLDAKVFAYTYLVLDERMGLQDSRLANSLASRTNLVKHRERIVDRYFT